MKKREKSYQTIQNTFSTMHFVLKFVWKENQGKSYILLKLITAMFNTIVPFLYIIFPGMLINELSSNRRLPILIIDVIMIAAIPFFSSLLNSLLGKNIYRLEMSLKTKNDILFFSHITSMDYDLIEDPEIQIIKDRSQNTLGKTFEVIDQFCNLVSALFGLLITMSVIFTLNPIFILLIILVAYVNSILLKRSNENGYKLSLKLSKLDRLSGPYCYKFDNLEYAQELRLFNLSKMLLDDYKRIKDETNTLTLKQYLIGQKCTILITLINSIQQLVMYILIIYQVLYYALPIGNMTIYTGVASQFSNSLNRLSGAYLSLARMGLDVQEMIEFLKIPTKNLKGSLTPVFNSNSTIEFQNVSFRYPGSEKFALENFSITLFGKDKLCIVGSNGSGKTTFVKLLTRMYAPTSGVILLNGINIWEYDYHKYLELFAPVLQDFKIYNMLSLSKNIVLTNEYNQMILDRVCANNGLKTLVTKLSNGYDSIPSKYIDENGFEPSGGEAQRIAIARACYRGGDIYILDEPTAALDPMAEYEIYTQFSNMITNKCALLITHRLSAVQLADKVAVFDNGQVAEYGTHESLYSKGGIYTEMFDKQAKFYRDERSSKE